MAVGYRFKEIAIYPIGKGKNIESPDKKYTFSISSFKDKSFWGKETEYYKYNFSQNNKVLSSKRIEKSPNEEFINMRNHDQIKWSEDSKLVTVFLNGKEIEIKP